VEADAQRAWVNDAIDSMKRFAGDMTYVANPGEQTLDRVRASYGPNCARWAALKAR
jgi:hypothetical protein